MNIDTYLQVEPRERRRHDGVVLSAAVVGATVKRPTAPRRGTIVVRLRLQIPAAAFEPLQPEAVVVIPAAMTEPHPIVVEATDPREEGS